MLVLLVWWTLIRELLAYSFFAGLWLSGSSRKRCKPFFLIGLRWGPMLNGPEACGPCTGGTATDGALGPVHQEPAVLG